MKMTLLCFLNTLMMATGQMLFKAGSAGKSIGSVLDIIKLFFSPIVLLASMFFFKETISPMKWLGVAIIVCGVFVATRG